MVTLTREEYFARAMLLGLRFVPKNGYFFDGGSSPIGRKRWDADTLEEISAEEMERRNELTSDLNMSWRDIPLNMRGTPA